MKFLIATKDEVFFRGQTVTKETIDRSKNAMLENQRGLKFEIMTDKEFDEWLSTQ